MIAASPPLSASVPLADARVAEILAACRSVFAEKGFDRASMQDLARAAGMSAGNFYRYFASKDAIVEAMVARDLAEIATQFAQIMGSDDPHRTLRERLLAYLEQQDAGESAIWVAIMAEARRKPAIGAMYEALHEHIRSHLLAAFARIAGIPREVAARRFGGHAEMLMLLVHGVRLRRMPGDGFEGSQLDGLVRQTMNRLLDEVFPSISSPPDRAAPKQDQGSPATGATAGSGPGAPGPAERDPTAPDPARRRPVETRSAAAAGEAASSGGRPPQAADTLSLAGGLSHG